MILGAHVSTAGGVSKAPLHARELGITAIQIFTRNQNRWHSKPIEPDEVERFKNNCTECGIVSTIAHDSYLINLCAVEDTKLELSLEAFKDELHRANLLQLDYLVMHPGSHMGAGTEAGLDKIGTSLNRLINEDQDGTVRVLLETTAGQGTNLGYRFEELATLLDKVDNGSRIGICLDTCHVFAAGYDFRTEEQYAHVLSEFDRIIGLDHLYAFHLNDSKRDSGSRVDRHEHIGEGMIGHSGFKHILGDDRFREHPGILETPGDMSDYKSNLELLDKYNSKTQ